MNKKQRKASLVLTEINPPRGYNFWPVGLWPIFHLPRQNPFLPMLRPDVNGTAYPRRAGGPVAMFQM